MKNVYVCIECSFAGAIPLHEPEVVVTVIDPVDVLAHLIDNPTHHIVTTATVQ